VTETKDLFDLLLEALLERSDLHRPGTATYHFFKAAARSSVAERFRSDEPKPAPFGPFGVLEFPYHPMGAIDSLDLFGLDELIIFAFYWKNRSLYGKVADIGANLGLHSIVQSRCGFSVKAYEPDPVHAGLLRRNLALNQIERVELFQAAVSTQAGKAEFVRVLGNTTGSHLVGAKDSYGEKETFSVDVVPIAPIFAWADLIKMDAEGHEAEMLCSSTAEDWRGTDVMLEVGNAANAQRIFAHLSQLGVRLFAQKIGWSRVQSVEEVPTSHREGSLFASLRQKMPW
jgi:FkbM family methyltransferase